MSNTTIWKFPLQTTTPMPKGARLLAVQVQGGCPCVWAEVDPNAPLVGRRLANIGTGWDGALDEGLSYVGTYQIGPLVFHLYDAGEVE